MAKEKQTDKSKKKSAAAKRAKELFVKKQHTAYKKPADFQDALTFCEGYKRFLDAGKTEREAVNVSVDMLKKAGYVPFSAGKKYKQGDKVYLINRKKAVIAATIGSKPLADGLRFSIAHVDSPRLDLKANPLYEAEQMSFFKTHYYGGIRKYQWVAIPLSMHGAVVKKDGEVVNICIGEDAGDVQFTITDLLPHLAAEQNKRTLAQGIKGEELNILVGSLPFEEEEFSEGVKLQTLHLLNQKYGITEEDFVRAEIEFVPAFKAADIGFDKSLLGAYGQDDRVCAYTALRAEIDAKEPPYTTVCVLTDKEETGSDGNTGLAGDYLFHFVEDLAEAQGENYRKILRNSFCLSADVNAAYDPTFSSVFEKNNSSFINRGVVLTKYTGARGKSGTSDASAEYMARIIQMLNENEIAWQTGELGKVDEGGGGTIAKFIANRNVDVVDVGVPVLSMHSPFEVTSKLDVYSTYCAFLVFAQGM